MTFYLKYNIQSSEIIVQYVNVNVRQSLYRYSTNIMLVHALI